MTIENIIQYVTSTPTNTNPNVLLTMLDEISQTQGGAVIGPDEPTDPKVVVWFKTTNDITGTPVSFEIRLKYNGEWKDISITGNNSLYVSNVQPLDESVHYWLDTSENENGGEE